MTLEAKAEELLGEIRAVSNQQCALIAAHDHVFVTVYTNLVKSQERADCTAEEVISGLIDYMAEQRERLRSIANEGKD